MKDLFTKNLGLKILSVLAAFVLWLVVVNVDDPVISKTYTSVPVEIINEDVLTEQGKCYEVLGDSDSINVVVTAHRSVIDGMSRDYIKATADLKALTSLDTVPIEVRSLRYSDRIESVTTRDANLKLNVENLVKKDVAVSVGYEGEPAEGYVLAGVENALSTITVSGPETLVALVDKVMAVADIRGINRDFTVTEPLLPYDEENSVISDERIKLSRTVTEIKYVIYATKEIPITSGFSGNPAPGFGTTGSVITEPSSAIIAGRGENYDDMEVIYIPPDMVSVEGASADVTTTVSIADYLPSGVKFTDPEFDQNVRVTVGITENSRKVIDVPLSNITIENLPDGYIASIADIGPTIPVEIQGVGDAFDRYSGDLVIGKIDASSLVPRGAALPEEADRPLTPGENDAVVSFDLPAGISTTSPVSVVVVVAQSAPAPADTDAESVVAPDGEADETAEGTTDEAAPAQE